MPMYRVLHCLALFLTLVWGVMPDSQTLPNPNLEPRSPQPLRGRCTELKQDIVKAFEQRFLQDQLLYGLSTLLPLGKREPRHNGNATHSLRQLTPTTVNVYFHVISADRAATNGSVPGQQIVKQVDALNMGFAETGLNFVLAGVDRTVNRDWFDNAGPDTYQQTAMKSSLRRGGRSDLNIYTVGFGTFSGLLGYATFPQSYMDAPLDDGVVVLFSSLPGGSLAGYNQGKTAVHETGHWFGLYHTFQGSCLDPGDYVEDTPPEGVPSEGCFEGRSTCPVADVVEGLSDPIREWARFEFWHQYDLVQNFFLDNYMDYSPDACMTGFTPGQALRARVQGQFYRGIY